MQKKLTTFIKKRFVLLTLASSIGIISLATVTFLPEYIDIDQYRSQILSEINKNPKFKVDLGKLKLDLTLLGHGIISTNSAIVVNKKDNLTVFSAKNLSINFSLLPLLQKKVEINNIKAKDLNLILKIKGKSGMEIRELFTLSQLKGPFRPVFNHTTGYIDKYKIILNDKISNRPILFDGNSFKLINFAENKYIAIQTSGIKDNITTYDIYAKLYLPFNKIILDNKLDLKAKINNLNLNELSYYTDYKNIQGVINLDSRLNLSKQNTSLDGQVKILQKITIPKYNLTVPPGVLKLNSILGNSKIDIKSSSILFDGIKTNIKGSITDIKSKIPQLKLSLLINDLQPNALNNFFITENTPVNNILRNYIGNISGNLDISGKTNMPKIKGDLSFNGIPSLFSGNIKFNDYNINFINNKINIDPNNFISITGGFDYNNKTFSNFKVNTSNLDLNKLSNEITALPEILPKVQQKLKNTNINGKVDINLVLNGDINKPIILGTGNLNSVNIKSKGFKANINNLTSTIFFDNTVATIKSLEFNITKSSQLMISGSYDFQKQYLNKLAINSKMLDIAELQDLLLSLAADKKVFKDFKMSGKIQPDVIIDGSIKKPSYKGFLLISKAQVLDNKTNYGVKNISGLIKLDNSILINNLTASLDNNPLKINGQILSKDNGQISILVNNFKVNSFKDFLIKFKLPKPKDIAFLQKSVIQGSVSGNMNFKILKNKVVPSSTLAINNISVANPELIEKITAKKGTLTIKDDIFTANNVLIQVKSTLFLLNGNIYNLLNNKTKYDINLTSKNINFDLVKSLAKSNKLPENLKEAINSLSETHGSAGIDVRLSNNKFNFIFDANKIGFKIPLLPKALENISGQVSFAPDNLLIRNLSINYGSSRVAVNSGIQNLKKSPQGSISTKGEVSLLDFNEFLPDDIKQDLIFTDPAIFEGKLEGSLNGWNLNLYSSLPNYSEVGIKGLFRKPKDTAINLSTDIRSSKSQLDIDKFLIELGQNQINLKGGLNYSTENYMDAKDLTLTIPEFEMGNLNQFVDPALTAGNMSGKIDSSIQITGPIFSPEVNGFINLNQIKLPAIQVDEITSNIQLAHQQADINKLLINLNGIIFEINSHVENIFSLPIQLSQFKISSPSISLNKFLALDLLKYPPLFTPLVIKDGRINFKEAIIDKLITTNMTGNLIFCENGLLQFNDLSMETAKGITKGNMYFSPLDGSVGAQLKVVGVKANAAATILLNMPNEIFGDLNAIIIFDTKGLNYEDMLKNAEGKAFLFVRDGRFTRLGNLEHLLTATNIFQGGIKRLNLNNIIAGLIPIHTGYFELLTGEFDVKEGVLSTSNLTSRGKNLSLELSGKYDIATENADLNIKGHMSRTVSGILGPLGKLNIGTITDLIPGIGFIPGVKRRIGLLDLIPGLGFLPGFGRSKHDKIRNFAVDIKGKLYDQSSVKNFRWVEE